MRLLHRTQARHNFATLLGCGAKQTWMNLMTGGGPVVDNLKFWSVFALLAGLIVFLGWRQPLRYRFMSAKEIAELHAPPPVPTPTPWIWDPNRSTKLDRDPYNQRGYSADPSRRRYSLDR